MPDNKEKLVSRRAFARQAAMISATASLAPASLVPAALATGSHNSSGHVFAHAAPLEEHEQLPENFPKLSPAGQAEAEARYQLVMSRHGARLSEEQKKLTRTLCLFGQPGLERLRTYSLSNGDVPALFLRPLVEREKPLVLKHDPASTSPTPKKP